MYEHFPSHPIWATVGKEDIIQRAMIFNNCLCKIFFHQQNEIPKHLLQNINLVSILCFVQVTYKGVTRKTNIQTQTPMAKDVVGHIHSDLGNQNRSYQVNELGKALHTR